MHCQCPFTNSNVVCRRRTKLLPVPRDIVCSVCASQGKTFHDPLVILRFTLRYLNSRLVIASSLARGQVSPAPNDSFNGMHKKSVGMGFKICNHMKGLSREISKALESAYTSNLSSSLTIKSVGVGGTDFSQRCRHIGRGARNVKRPRRPPA